MFDNPKKHLQWMEEALLAEEDEDLPEAPDSPEEPELDWEQLLLEDWDPTEPPKSNPALNFATACYADEEFDEEAALSQGEGTAARVIAQNRKREALRQEKEAQRKAKKEQKAEKPRKGIGGLVVLAILEILGIFLILGWWITWLL